MISSKLVLLCIHDINDLTLQINFDVLWAWKDVRSKQHIAWNTSRHLPSWRFDFNCGIEETGSSVIVHIICHQVHLHPSELVISSMGKYVLANAPIPMLNELTMSEVTGLTSSTIHETSLAILKMEESQGIIIVSSHRQIIFHTQLDTHSPEWQKKPSKLAAKDLETSEFHQNMWNRYLMFGFVSAHVR